MREGRRCPTVPAMTNIGATATTPRSQGVETRSNMDDVIEGIECLRLSRAHSVGSNDSGRGVAVRAIESNDRDHDHDEDRDVLIERGPIKSQFFAPARDQPYCWPTGGEWTRHAEASETFAIDYEKTVEQILRDKECGEKLNACLDQLQNLDKTGWPYCGGGKALGGACPARNATDGTGEAKFGSFQRTLASSSDDLLLESVLCGAFQAAQRPDGVFSSPEPGNTREDRRADTSRSAPANFARSSPPRANGARELDASNFSCGPTFQVAARNLPFASSCSSSSTSFSSSSSSSNCSSYSSSNQSFCDMPSPGSSTRTFFLPRAGKRFGEDCENDAFCKPDRETIGTGRGVDDNIDDDDLWSKVVEQLVGRAAEERDAFQRVPDVVADTENCGIVAPLFDCSIALCPTEEQVPGHQDPCKEEAAYHREDDEYSRKSAELEFSSLFQSLNEEAVPCADALPSHAGFQASAEKGSTTLARDDFEIPKMVACFESRPRRRRSGCSASNRTATPWSSLNLPAGKSSERLKAKLNPREVEKAMTSLLKRPAEELARQDEDGDTMLMCLVGNQDELAEKMAYLVPLVERSSTVPGALTAMNDRGEDALYLAALNCPRYPYVAGYLAATMMEKGVDVSQRLYHTRGDTLIHSIAAQGDSHAEILAELLALTTAQGNAVFDLSKRNYDGRTAVHVAVESRHSRTGGGDGGGGGGAGAVATVELLLKYGADPRIKETRCGDTALHMAISLGCDPAVVKVLLDASVFDVVNAINYNHDTPLHVAAAASKTVPAERLTEVCSALIQAGARTNMVNRQGRTPLALVSPERKDVVKKIFHRRS